MILGKVKKGVCPPFIKWEKGRNLSHNNLRGVNVLGVELFPSGVRLIRHSHESGNPVIQDALKACGLYPF